MKGNTLKEAQQIYKEKNLSNSLYLVINRKNKIVGTYRYYCTAQQSLRKLKLQYMDSLKIVKLNKDGIIRYSGLGEAERRPEFLWD